MSRALYTQLNGIVAMRSVDGILNKIKQLTGAKTDTELAGLFNVRPQTVATWRKRHSIPYALIVEYCENENINLSWLLTEQTTTMYMDADGKMVSTTPAKEPEEENFVGIDVYALAGAGGAKDLVGPTPVETIVVPKEYVKPSIVAVKVKGEGMEPTLYDGAVVGVDKEDRQIISGKVYAVWLEYEGAVIKRLYVEPDRIVLKSDNPQFPASYIKDRTRDDFILGRVRWVVQEY